MYNFGVLGYITIFGDFRQFSAKNGILHNKTNVIDVHLCAHFFFLNGCIFCHICHLPVIFVAKNIFEIAPSVPEKQQPCCFTSAGSIMQPGTVSPCPGNF
jgi:hypothetical protein